MNAQAHAPTLAMVALACAGLLGAAPAPAFAAQPSLTLLAPAPGQVFSTDDGITVRWRLDGAPADSHVGLEVRRGGVWSPLVDWIPADAGGGRGQHTWKPLAGEPAPLDLRVVYRGQLPVDAPTLLASVKAGEQGKVDKILAANPGLAASRDAKGWTALHWAVFKKQVAIARALVQAGAPLEARSGPNAVTALASAASSGNTEMAKLLVDLGANASAVDRRQLTPLMLARQNKHAETAQMLAGLGALSLRPSTLFGLLKARDDKRATQLLAAAPQLVHGVWGDWPLLHLAVQQGEVEVLRYLLQHGAKADQQDKQGQTPLHVAVRHPKLDANQRGALVGLLLGARANPNLSDRAWGTPLHYLLAASAPEGDVRRLLQAGADPNGKTLRGEAPVHLARDRGVLELLLNSRARVDITDGRGDALVHKAARECDQGLMDLLRRYSPNLGQRNGEGMTPAQLAARELATLRTRMKNEMAATQDMMQRSRRCASMVEKLPGQ